MLQGRESSSLLAFGFAELINQVRASQVFGRFCGVMSRMEVPEHVISESSVAAKTADQLKEKNQTNVWRGCVTSARRRAGGEVPAQLTGAKALQGSV